MRRNCNFHKLPPNASSSSWSMIFGNNHLLSFSDPNQIEFFGSDATELQAICILLLAGREREHKSKNDHRSSAFLHLQAHGCRGLSFKKSLQKHFQKRKERMQASMPY